MLASLMSRSPRPVLSLTFMAEAMCLYGQARFTAELLQGTQDRFVGILSAASVLPAGGVDVITVRVDDETMARADEGAAAGRRDSRSCASWRRASCSSCGIGTPRYWLN